MKLHKKKKIKWPWQVWLGLVLVASSALIYFIHYLFFHDLHHILIYLVGDIAFVPIEVLLVTLILHKLLTNMEKTALMEKMNMIIGAFFSEVGTELLKYFSDCDPELQYIKEELLFKADCNHDNFQKASAAIKGFDYKVDMKKIELMGLRGFLQKHRDFLVRLLENPNLLEHESFTELLWAVFHLTEELMCRTSFADLPKTDIMHLSGDIKRVYLLLVKQWLDYMEHLKKNYPYLYSLAVRTNPFDEKALAVVME